MKVLRAIGAFFAKIGRWIANTAWIQPLLIVGGIFGIIFSIPYIKQGIEGLQTDTTDYEYEYYSDHALALEKDGKADKLLGYLENFEEHKEDIKSEFGSQFFLSFVKADCSNCKDCVDGFKSLDTNFKKWELKNKFKFYTILVDKTDDDDEYMAKPLLSDHNDLFNEIAAEFGEDPDYALFKNKESVKSEMVEKIKKLPEVTLDDGEGMDTPTTFMIDVDDNDAHFSTNGITAVLFNFTTLIDNDVNYYTKGEVLRDCWSYSNLFDPDYQKQLIVKIN